MTIAFIILAIVMMGLAVPLFLVFGIGSAGVAVFGLGLPSHTLLQLSFDAISKQVLVSIPIFVFAGNVMYHSGAARRLVDVAVALVGHLSGGLAVALILAIGIFSAISGSILASIVAIGSVMMPALIAQGYPKPFVIVLAATAALIDALIPPSNTAIIYSALTHVPVPKAFAAGILPGFVLMGLLTLYVMWYCRKMPRPMPALAAQRWFALWVAIPALALPVLILGGLYGGLLTPSEAASVASVYAILLGVFVYRELTWRGLWKALTSTAETTTIIFAIIAMAVYFSVIMTYTKTPQTIVDFFILFNIGPLTFMALAGIALLFLGTFIEVVPIFYLAIPILLPLCVLLNVDLLHFYVYLVGLVGIGMITPPVCVGLYTAAAIVREPPQNAFRAVPGFFMIGLVYSAIVLFFPQLATWLPKFW